MLPFLRTSLLKRGPAIVARTTRPMPRRNYATVHATHTGSDMPWIIGSVAFTVPAALYLMSGSDHKPVAHDKHSTVGRKAESAKQSLANAASKPSEKASEVTQSAKKKAAEATSNAQKDRAKGTAESVKETASETAEQVKEKGSETAERAKEGASEATGKARQTVSETTEKAKGKASELTSKAKEATSDVGEKAKASKENVKDKVLSDDSEATRGTAERETLEDDATSRKAGSTNVQSGKQEGLSNSDTSHSELAGKKGKDISKKAEGVHDSAKLKGTVDPARRGS